MPESKSNLRPVQVFLDTKKFIEIEEPREFSGHNRDFFDNDDEGFARHKDHIRGRLQNISDALKTRKQPAGFVRVQLREEALAKSYRPLGSLFKESRGFALVGAGSVGELVFQATPESLTQLDRTVEDKAETTPRKVRNNKGEIETRISGYRSEVGAISEVELHGPTDRIPFSADEAIAWLKDPGVLGGYIVELFRPNADHAPEAVRAIVSQLYTALATLPCGVAVRPFVPSGKDEKDKYGEPSCALIVKLLQDERKDITLPSALRMAAVGSQHEMPRDQGGPRTTNLKLEHHRVFLDRLAEQALVRCVDLPPLIEATPESTATAVKKPTISAPMPGSNYPIVGIIDGGVADIPELSAWRAGDAGLVPPTDRDEGHGTFIAGLVVAGGALNPHLASRLEPQGCKYFDLDLFPRRELRERYLGNDLDFFFDLLDEKIKIAKREYVVRVFNLSFTMRMPSARFAYTPLADRLDRLAIANDVIIVVSAGNLVLSRPPWPKNPTAVTTMLATFGTGVQHIMPPGEHLLGLTVGAINPPGLKGHEEELPTTYTRRGPGVGGARKPDLCHFGGADGGPTLAHRTGLASFSPSGICVEKCGTSFAAPNIAATLATLDHRLAHSQSREVLLALLTHKAKRAKPLAHPTLRHISREFVGFGLPPTADNILVDEGFAITLIFSERLHHRQKLEFPFPWPAAMTKESGQCRGRADLTLAYTPPIDADHKDEAQRIQLEAHLYQEAIDPDTGEMQWESRLMQDGSGVPQGMNKTERYLLRTGLKWSPIKRYALTMAGKGSSSNWQLGLTSLTRAGATYPAEGIPFTIVLTISDPKAVTPIHDAVRTALVARGLTLADITVAHRIRSRVH